MPTFTLTPDAVLAGLLFLVFATLVALIVFDPSRLNGEATAWRALVRRVRGTRSPRVCCPTVPEDRRCRHQETWTVLPLDEV
jgi:hypothetical protein